MYFNSDLIRLKVGTGWTDLTLVSEVGVVNTRRGYVPAVEVERGETRHLLLLGAASLADPLERIRLNRGGLLKNLKVRIRKTGEAAISPYEVEETS